MYFPFKCHMHNGDNFHLNKDVEEALLYLNFKCARFHFKSFMSLYGETLWVRSFISVCFATLHVSFMSEVNISLSV